MVGKNGVSFFCTHCHVVKAFSAANPLVSVYLEIRQLIHNPYIIRKADGYGDTYLSGSLISRALANKKPQIFGSI